MEVRTPRTPRTPRPDGALPACTRVHRLDIHNRCHSRGQDTWSTLSQQVELVAQVAHRRQVGEQIEELQAEALALDAH